MKDRFGHTIVPPHAVADVVKAKRSWDCLHCKNYIQAKALYFRVEVKGADDFERYPRYGAFCGPTCFTIFINDFLQGYYWWIVERREIFERLVDGSNSFKLTRDVKEYLVQHGWRKFTAYPGEKLP